MVLICKLSSQPRAHQRLRLLRLCEDRLQHRLVWPPMVQQTYMFWPPAPRWQTAWQRLARFPGRPDTRSSTGLSMLMPVLCMQRCMCTPPKMRGLSARSHCCLSSLGTAVEELNPGTDSSHDSMTVHLLHMIHLSWCQHLCKLDNPSTQHLSHPGKLNALTGAGCTCKEVKAPFLSTRRHFKQHVVAELNVE